MITHGAWTVAEAEAKFSEMVDQIRVGAPQTITKHGQPTVVVLPAEEWERKARRDGNLAEFFFESPLRGSDLQVSQTNWGKGKVMARGQQQAGRSAP